MTPERQAVREVLDKCLENADPCGTYEAEIGCSPCEAMYALYDEIERLRGLVVDAHGLTGVTHQTTHEFRCTCDEWDYWVPFQSPSEGSAVNVLMMNGQIKRVHAAHVAELVDGTP